MARESYVYRDGQLWLRGTEPPGVRVPRSDLPAPAIRPDGMSAVRSMADGRMYDSKSGYYRSVKDAGCEIVGDDREALGDGRVEYKPEGIGQSIKDAIDQLEARL